jgi:hypothetical protein
MEVGMQQTWMEIILTAVHDVGRRLAYVTPRLLAALTLVAIGWVVAVAVRRLATRLLGAADLDGRCRRSGLSMILVRGGIRTGPTEIVGRVLFWAVFLIGLLTALEALEMPGTAGALAGALALVPHVVVAILVLIGGWILAQFLAQATVIAAVNAQVAGASLLAASVRWMVLIVAAAIALTELGVAREMVLLTFGIAFGGAVLALALAFGLGARELAREALEGYLRRAREEGESISHV